MGEKVAKDAKMSQVDLQDDGKVDIMSGKQRNVLQPLKQKIKDGSTTDMAQRGHGSGEQGGCNSSSAAKDPRGREALPRKNKRADLRQGESP